LTINLATVETAVLRDLFDPTNLRWATADIDRAIDKAVDRYTQYYPNISFVDMQMEPYQRTYPYPTSWNASYPVQWIERVLYPLQVYGSYFAVPASAPSAVKAAGSGLGTGVYQYLTTFLTQGGETPAGPSVSVTTTGGNNQVSISNLPIGPATAPVGAIATNYVIGRNIYRTNVGGSTFFLLTTIQDNTSTTYTDSTADASLFTVSPPTVNTSGVMTWPPVEKNFAEYSNMYDSNTALASGGNQGTMGAIGSDSAGPTGTASPSFTVILSPAELPKDNTLVMRVFYATKQQLDSNGTTIPEVHRDIIVLGACAYAIEAYLTPTLDNFEFQDGGLRDKVKDDTIPEHWMAWAKVKMDQFIDRLEEIKQQRDFASSSRAHWGDIPFRYWRL